MFNQILVVESQTLELNVSEPHSVLNKLAELLGTTCEDGYLKVPEDKGKGYLRGFFLGNSLGMMIRDCEFNTDLLVKRNFNLNPHERVLMSFNNILTPNNMLNPNRQIQERANIQNLPSVQIGKGKLNLEMFYPSHTNFRSILVAIYVRDLKKLLGSQIENSILRSILENENPVLFEEIITPAIQKVALEVTENKIPKALNTFYYRLKAEELICLVFAELLKRENTPMHAINEVDAAQVYQIRSKILAELATPPNLAELAEIAGMSKSKLTRLFKQIFGESMFNYYQSFRMREAARLLQAHKLTVSEVGYEMGFTNLGHFTRVFEAHLGMKPKKYSLL
jgi:AraC-like DNA-binding protein